MPINRNDIDAVLDVLRSDFITQGPNVPGFEHTVANYCGAANAIAVNSATSALHIACLALDVGPGDIVWTSPITFVASANCALYCGATVDFIDIDPLTFNMSVAALEEKLAMSEKRGGLPKVVIPVHMCGQPCDMAGIHALGEKYGFKIIEDASHAVGASYREQKVGSCRYSDITVFSFHPVKIITTGEGGMALTNDNRLARRMNLLRSHGVTRDPSEMSCDPDGPWYYEQIDLGYNYRMTDLQAALGTSQMQRIDDFVVRRHAIFDRYEQLLSGISVVLPWQSPESVSALHLYVVRLPEQLRHRHRQVFESMRGAGIGVNLHYMPVYLQPYYQRSGFVRGYCPEAEKYYSEAISLPMYPDLSDNQQEQVAQSLHKALL